MCARYDVTPPPNFQKNVMVALITSPYATDLSVVTEALSSHITSKCGTSSSNLIDNTYPINLYAVNPSSIRAISYQRMKYIQGRGGSETIGYILIQVLWESQINIIVNIIFEDSEADTYK